MVVKVVGAESGVAAVSAVVPVVGVVITVCNSFREAVRARCLHEKWRWLLVSRRLQLWW